MVSSFVVLEGIRFKFVNPLFYWVYARLIAFLPDFYTDLIHFLNQFFILIPLMARGCVNNLQHQKPNNQNLIKLRAIYIQSFFLFFLLGVVVSLYCLFAPFLGELATFEKSVISMHYFIFIRS